MTRRLKLLSQLVKVVDFAIENNPALTRFIGHRLMPLAGKVKDRQSPMSQQQPRTDQQPSIVGTPVRYRIDHPQADILRQRYRLPVVVDACQTAHSALPLSNIDSNDQ